ncbi:MAG TPA: hypothetical protein VFY85_00275 [Gemmatimonadaceae bacterium]|nr:hypothetical protein [Gemmatimonadaceae bacterium]
MRDGGSSGSSAAAARGSTAALAELERLAIEATRIPTERRGRWHRAGLTPRVERRLDVASGAVVVLLVVGWVWSITMAVTGRLPNMGVGSASAAMAASLTSADATSAAYLTDATLNALVGNLRGASGKLRVEVVAPGEKVADTVVGGASLRVESPGTAGSDVAPRSGIFRVVAAIGSALKPVGDFSVIGLVPSSTKRNGKVGLYYVGNWPGEKGGRVNAPGKAPPDRYQPPSGFIEVTKANADTRVSEHFRLRDFLTHDQPNVWPKYLVLQMRNVDKLELVLSDLAQRGIDVSGVTVMSGFRSPQYNEGGGNTGGRASLSRHMYGDAADIFIDSNHDGVMDDLNHDGRISIADSRVIQQAVDRVEAAHPELVGGAGVYPAESGHGPFIHIDSRGYRARWVGSGGG